MDEISSLSSSSLLSRSNREEYIEEYVQDDNVYHYYDDDGAVSDGDGMNWAPPPPSEASASIIEPAPLRDRKPLNHRSRWKPVNAPKLDASGKQSALWTEEVAESTSKKGRNNFVVGGIDCLAMAKRLKNCWVLPEAVTDPKMSNKKLKQQQFEGMTLQERDTLLEVRQMAEAICYADRMFDSPEGWIDAILNRPWDQKDKVAEWEKAWAEIDISDKKEVVRRREGLALAMQRAFVAEQAFERIEKVEKEILRAAKKQGFSANEQQDTTTASTNTQTETGKPGEVLVSFAATRLQAMWRGCRSRRRLNELKSLELAELEAGLVHDVKQFKQRDHGALETEARRRAARKFELLSLEEQEEELREENRAKEKLRKTSPLLISLPPGLEVARLTAGPDMGMVQQYMDVAFELYVGKVWRAFSVLRAEITRSDPALNVSDFEHELRKCASYGEDGRVSRNDLCNWMTSFCPSMSSYQRELVLTFLDKNVDGLIPVERIGTAVRGSLSDRRHLLCNMVFDIEYFSKSEGVLALSGRLHKLTEFYRQFVPEEFKSGKPLKVHRKYKDTEKVNKDLFQKLYNKYAPWLEAPEYLWSQKAQRQEQERQCMVRVEQVVLLYTQYLQRKAHTLPTQAKASLERALSSLRSGTATISTSTKGELNMRRADWLAFHAELSAGVTDNTVFEKIVTEASSISHDRWIKFAEDKSRRELKRRSHESWLRSIANGEKEKMSQLEQTLSAANFEQYSYDLKNVLRKVRSSMLKVSGADRNLGELEKEIEASASFGDDRKVSRKDFRRALARYGVVLTREEMTLLQTHYDNDNSGYVVVDGFLHGVQESQRKRNADSRVANELKTAADLPKRRKRWIKAMSSTILPESKKIWIRYTQRVGPNKQERPYWYCRITGERTWKKPSKFERNDKAVWEKETKRRLKQSLNLLEKYRGMAGAMLDIQLDVIKSTISTALPLVGTNMEGLPSLILSSTELRGLTSLFLDRNQLTEVPSAITELRSLRRLSLVGNSIEHLPAEDFRQPDSCYNTLQSLRLNHNKLTTIPKCLSEISSLSELELAHNHITHIPEQALSGLELKALDLTNNRLRALPVAEMCWVSLSNTLEWFSVCNNQLMSVPRSLGERLHCVKYLDLRDNRIEQLPESFGAGLRTVETLLLQGNNLLSLPEDIGKAKSLKEISLQHNALSLLPNSLCLLGNLVTLSVNNNRLTELPARIGDLNALETLYAQCNRLIKIPSTFGHMTALTSCWLHQNEISSLPGTLPPKLLTLKLHNNQLREIPASLGEGVKKLQHIDLAGNRIETIPTSFYHLRDLQYLRLDNNPNLSAPIQKITKRGFYATPEEQNFALLLRKLVDSLKNPMDIQGRVDVALHISVAQALLEAKQEATEKLQRAKEVALGTISGARGNEEENENKIKKKGNSPAQQCLSLSLERFSKHEGRDGTVISEKGFRKCLTVIGILLTEVEIDRLTARVFHMFIDEGEDLLVFEKFVSSIEQKGYGCSSPSSVVTKDGSKTMSAANNRRHRDVAHSIIRYCSAQRAKITFSTLDKLNATMSGGGGTSSTKSKPTVPCKAASSEGDELRILEERNKELDKEVAQLKCQLDINTRKAKIVQELDRLEPHRPNDPFSSPTSRKHKHKSKNISGEEEAKVQALHAEKADLRRGLREKNRLIQQMKRSLNQTQAMARYYTDEMNDEYLSLKEKQNHKRKKHTTELKMKNMSNAERQQIKQRKQKRVRIAKIFQEHSRKPVGAHKPVISRGEMIAAAGDFYREFGRGRFGLDPQEWREKLLRTCNEAFHSGYKNQKTKRFERFDRDDSGVLDYNGFVAFCNELERRILACEHDLAKPEKVASDFVLEEQTAGEEVRSDRVTVFIDFISSVEKVIPFEVRSLNETVGSLKTKIGFCESILKDHQLLIFNGERLDDKSSLKDYGIRSGSKIKLVLYPTNGQ